MGSRLWHWRCSREKCKARHHSRLHPDEYKRGWKCKACGGTKYRIIADRSKDRCDTLCTCGAYQWVGPSGFVPHRRGSRACHFNIDGTLRVPVRKQSDRLHPQAWRTRADLDEHGVVWFFYDGEAEYETTWAREPDKVVAQLGGVQGMLELPPSLADGGEQRASRFLAEWMDGSAHPCHSGMGRFREDQSDLRRGGTALMVDWYRAYCRSCCSTPASVSVWPARRTQSPSPATSHQRLKR